MRPTVLLFDIDGTLIDGKGSGRQAMGEAFDRVVGSSAALAGFSFAGMTDRAIVRTGLAGSELDPDTVEATIDRVLEVYLERLHDAIGATEGFARHVGVEALLDALRERDGVAVGLGTGNVKAGARIKLAHVHLWDYFGFGGFGCDHELRADLLEIGARRGAAELGYDRQSCRVVVIGDTPKDIDAGRAIGAEVIAVATSWFDVETLRAAGATMVVRDLEGPEIAPWLLAGQTGPKR